MNRKIYTISALFEYVEPLRKAGFNVKLFDSLNLLYDYVVKRNKSDCLVISNMYKPAEGLNGGTLATNLMYGGDELEKIPVVIFSNGLTDDIIRYELRLPNIVYKDIRPDKNEVVEIVNKYINHIPYYGNELVGVKVSVKKVEITPQEGQGKSHQKVSTVFSNKLAPRKKQEFSFINILKKRLKRKVG